MKQHINLTRAIGSEFLARKLAGLRLLFIVVAVLLLGLMIWLVTVSAWWWLLAVPVMSGIIIIAVILLLVGLLVKFIRPQLDGPQTAGIKSFVDKLERVAENVQTPPFLIVFYVLKDVIMTPEKTYVERVAADSTSLHSDLIKLRKLFA